MYPSNHNRIWVCVFILAFHSSINYTTRYEAYAKFSNAPQVATAQILSTIIGGVLKLPMAKTMNLWGRSEGLLFYLVIFEIALIVLASSDGPNAFAAGWVLYYIAYNGMYLTLNIFVADASGLRNRAFAFAFIGTPFILSAFTASPAAESFINNTGWRWAYGSFAIIMPFVICPLGIVFKLYERKAAKMGLFKHVPSGRTVFQSINHYFHEFDGECPSPNDH